MQIHQRTSTKQKIGLIIFGVFLCMVILEAGLRTGGFILRSLQEHRNRSPIKQKGTYHILCLGESTTADGGNNSYPRQLERILNKRNTGAKFKVINKGDQGAYSTSIVAELDNNIKKYNPDIIVVMMGINDRADTMAYEDIPYNRTALFLKSFRIHKLARLLRLHIIHKIEEKKLEIYRMKKKLSKKTSHSKQRNRSTEKKKTIKENPGVYANLSDNYWGQGTLAEVEKMLKQAIETNSRNYEAYENLEEYYRYLGDIDKAEKVHKTAEKMLKETIAINPKNDEAYLALADNYWEQGKLYEVEKMLKQAIKINPKNNEAYEELGNYYWEHGKLNEAEETQKEAIKINPENDQAYRDLGMYYMMHRKYDKAEKVLKKAMEINPESDQIYAELLYVKQERRKIADGYFKKTNNIEAGWYAPVTIQNYQILKEAVTKKGIKLVCMQYPLRSIVPLKEILEAEETLTFVDNEKTFKEAVERENYDEYFIDRFGGDFGHCTIKGNRLLAENVANVILEELFKKKF